MVYDEVKKAFLWYLTKSLQGDEPAASEIYHDDAVLEFPQSGERFRGKAQFIPWRSVYPEADIEFVVRSIRGAGDTWVAEGQIRYGGGDLLCFVDILHFRDTLVDRETIYVAEPFPGDASRVQFAERSDLESTPGLPVRVRTGAG